MRRAVGSIIWVAAVLGSSVLGSAAAIAADGADTSAAAPAIATDRPGFGTGASIVPVNHLQIEAGVTMDFVDGGAVGDVARPAKAVGTAPNLLARFGIADIAEIRLQVPNGAVDFKAPIHDDPVHWGALTVGAKVGAPVAANLSVAVVPFVSVGVEDGGVSAGAIGVVDVSATDWLGVQFNGVVSRVDTDARNVEFDASIGASFALADPVGAYVEWHGEALREATHFGEAGLTFLVTPRWQLDAYVGAVLPDADTIYAGVGVSALF